MTSSSEFIQFFQLLGHDLRWQMLQALSKSDLRVQELASVTHQPQNLVSYHLARLHQAGFVREHRSIADGREVFFSLEIKAFTELFQASLRDLHPALADRQGMSPAALPVRVLFVCTHNSARSQMAEGLLNRSSRGQVNAFSAGTAPTGVHPITVQVMAERDIDLHTAQSRALSAFHGQEFDLLITVCDRVRHEAASLSASGQQMHWSLPDPVEVRGTFDQRLAAFRSVANELESRVAFLLDRLFIPISDQLRK